MIGFLGKKISMSYLYDSFGNYNPVTILSIYDCYVFDLISINNFYFAIISYYSNNFYCFNKSKFFLKQFFISYFDYSNFNLFEKISLNIFYINQKINVSGISIGKGFSGVIKRYNFNSGYASHGNSKAHNKPGSIGMCQDPGRVYPGKKMAGHLGSKKTFIKNLKILYIDFNYNIFYIKGSVPGFINSNIIIYPSK
ncbi:50S ribosomal subunit protein L3 [Candidatus Nasuia deltocephalinicola]|uniref:50S ribosomal protein L3 n=1 Tax=Candidatus Nasuia deltocephalincola TaxID=1160784 RepID=A0A975A350_9PROT|nr:50S ribosomal protein L3 [Candidatus Nasuia deltocephalinicola]BEH03950.1 50S ribosomal subunit protein L3 [Candidatus Nasuia deltocephalinicola]